MPHSGDIFGIYDSHFKNVVGLDRMSPKPRDKIVPIKSLTHCDESVIYAGCSFVHFGHILLEGLSRLWFVLANAQDSRKLVFVGYGGWDSFDANLQSYYELLALLGIEKSRLIIVKEPTKFAHITIPDISALCIGDGIHYTKKYPPLYRHITQKANEIYAKRPKFDRIFLSHSRWKHRKNQLFLNEDIFDKVFAKLGFKVLYPEEISVGEMAYLMSNATQVATTMGTAAHFGLFCKENSRFIVLTRDHKPVLTAQCLVQQAAKLDYFIINATQNYLPSTSLVLGLINFELTSDFMDFCEDNFSENLSEFFAKYNANFAKERRAFAYLQAFAEFFATPSHVNEVLQDASVYEFANRLSEIFSHKTLDKGLFLEALRGENLSKNKSLSGWRYILHKKIIYNLFKKPIKSLRKCFKKQPSSPKASQVPASPRTKH